MVTPRVIGRNENEPDSRSRVKCLEIALSEHAFATLPALTPRLDNLGFEVHVLLTDEISESTSYPPDIKIAPFTVEQNPSGLGKLSILKNLVLYMIRERFSIVHVHGDSSNLPLSQIARVTGVPVLFKTVFSGDTIEEPSALLRLGNWGRNKAVRGPDVVMAETVSAIADLTTGNHDGNCEIKWIGNGIDLTDAVNTEDNSNTNRPTTGVGRILGLVTQTGDDPGAVAMIRAMRFVTRELPDARLMLVDRSPSGRATRDTSGQLLQTISANGLGANVSYHRDGDSTVPEFCDVDLLVNPTHTLATSKWAMLAMASGKPVVTIDAPGIGEIVEDGVTGVIVPSGDSRAMARAIVSLLTDDDTRLRMGWLARQRALRSFDINRQVDRIAETYMAWSGIASRRSAERVTARS